MPDEVTLKQLIEASAKGDAVSFRTLSERFDDKLFAYILARAASRDEALDTLQDVLVDLWQALRSFTYRSDAEFYGFLYLIAKRRLYQVWGKRRDVSLADEQVVADERGENTELRLAVEGALEELDETAREIVLLRHWSRYSFKEIGEMMEMEENAVRVRHHRALRMLQESLTQHDQ